ncbi:MAG TPA: hypothetical protein DCY42_02520 [Chloroflexi bacterium]|nr:hypothetical protein [Chloroflexota bacterium]
MGKNPKENLLDLISTTYPGLFEQLEGVELERVVFEESGWRGRELLSHMAAWNLVVATTLEHFSRGEDYLIPDLEEDEFNQRTALEHQDLPVDEVKVYWKHSVEELTLAIEKIPAEKFPGDLLYPWGDERGDIIQLVKYFIDHDEEHVAEILK